MPLSSVMGAAQTNINSSNIQLYGGRKVFADANALRGDISGMMAANREYNTYLSGLARLTGAGAQMLDKFWSAMLETQERDTETALSKAYRDAFTELSLDEKYQGAGAMGLSNAFMDKKKDVYDKFREDNPDVNKRILNNIDARLQNRYYDRIGALQTDRLAQWHTQSKINNFTEAVDTASLSQLGDFNALQDIANKQKELFGNDPVRGRTMADEALKTVIQAWSGQNPSAFLAQADTIKAKAIQIFGGSNAKNIDAVIQHAKSQVRADASFAMAVENHNKQMMLFRRAEESRATAMGITEMVIKSAQEGKPVEITPQFFLTPGADGKRPIDKMMAADSAALFKNLSMLGMPIDFNPDKTDERNAYIFMQDDANITKEGFKQHSIDLRQRNIITEQEFIAGLERHNRAVNAQEKAGYETAAAQIKQSAVMGDPNALQQITAIMGSPYAQDADYRFVLEMGKQANDARELLGGDMLKAQLDMAQAYIAPKNELTGFNKSADTAAYNQFVVEFNRLASDVKRRDKMTITDKRNALDLNIKGSEADQLFQKYMAARGGFRDTFNHTVGSFAPTRRSAANIPAVPYAQPQRKARRSLKDIGSGTAAPVIKTTPGNPTGDK